MCPSSLNQREPYRGRVKTSLRHPVFGGFAPIICNNFGGFRERRERLFPPRQRVVRFDQCLQPLAEDMGIDLRRRDIGMAEHLLNAAQIGAVVEEMAGEGMPQDVG